jgi:hypothetical protein
MAHNRDSSLKLIALGNALSLGMTSWVVPVWINQLTSRRV